MTLRPAALRIDARGMRCPWPAVRLARALRDGATEVEILADDPAAPEELGAVAQAADADVVKLDGDGTPTFLVTKRFAINRSFTPA